MTWEPTSSWTWRGQVQASRHEHWTFAEEDRGIEVLISRPDLVRSGFELLSWPIVVFLQYGYSVYTLCLAARRSGRIGQEKPVEVYLWD